MTAPTGGAGSGQAPNASGDPQNTGQGQAPQANNNGGSTPNPPASPAPQAGGDHTQSGGQQSAAFSLDDAQRMITELRRENAAHRTRLKAFEDAQAAAEMASLSETEKLKKQYEQAQQQLAELQIEQQQYRLAREIARHAPSLNLIDPDAAALMLTAGGELDYDAEGKPTNVAKLLEKLVAEKPYLVASNVRPPAAPPSSGGATNPGRPGAGAPPAGQQQSAADPKALYKNRKGLSSPDLWKRS